MNKYDFIKQVIIGLFPLENPPPKLIRDEGNIFTIDINNDSRIINEDISTISLDIFDTILFHKVEPFIIREYEIARLSKVVINKYINDVNWGELFLLRRSFFEQSKKETGDEVDYIDAYNKIMLYLGVNINENQKIIEDILYLEEQYMKNVTYLNPEVIRFLDLLKYNNKKIIAISDMYLPKKTMENLLKYHGIYDYFTDIFISSENLLTKHSGEIYKNLIVNKKIEAFKTLHIGDNYSSDVLNAVPNNLKALHYYSRKNLKRISYVKRNSIKKLIESDGFSRKFIDYKKNIIESLADCLTIFVKNLASFCIKNNKKSVYFLTRDASFLKDYFNFYIKKNYKSNQIITSELAINRLFAIFLNIKDESDFFNSFWALGVDAETISVKNLLKKLSENIFDEYKSDFEKWEYMSYSNARLDDNFVRKINLLCRNINKKIVNYVFDQNLLNNKDIVLVDIGYSGTTFVQISDYIKETKLNLNTIDCFLFATNKFVANNFNKINHPVRLHLKSIIDFYNAPSSVTTSFSWLEPFVLDVDKGRLLNYIIKDGFLEPVFDKPIMLTRQHLLYKKILLDKISKNIDLDINIELENSLINLYGLLTYPDTKTLNIFKNISLTFGYTNDKEICIVKKIGKLQFFDMLEYCQKNDLWIGGCLKESNLKFLGNKIFNYLKSESLLA